jgi:hypothetical protein
VRRAAALVAALAVAGCGGPGQHRTGPPKPQLSLGNEAAVRLWTRAVYEGRYRRAASYFAPGAVVHQERTQVLRSRADAVAFVRGLTCRPTVKRIRPEAATTVIVTFNLGPGSGGGCQNGGRVDVRLGIRAGRFVSWRQLTTP